MSVRAILDTCILVDYLRGVSRAREELARHRDGRISLITWMEVMVGARNEEEEDLLRTFLGRFDVEPVTPAVAEEAVLLRRGSGLRLPDAIIWATARTAGGLLVTRNTRDFPSDDPGVRVPYRIR